MTKMMFASWHDSVHHLCLDLLPLGLLELGFPLSRIGERHNLEVPPLDLWRPL